MRPLQCCVAAYDVATHNVSRHFHVVPRGGLTGAKWVPQIRKEPEMFNTFKARIAKRARYNRMVDEIKSLTERDLADFNGNRTDMLRAAYQDVYGR